MKTEFNRCPWCISDPLYMKYHDEEWGVPKHDDRIHFEFLVLESAQAGLSWLTILKRREGYRRLYHNFDPEKVADFNEQTINSMLQDTGIIRNRKKVESSVNNARLFIDISAKFGSFDNYIWNFTDGKVLTNYWSELSEVPANTKLSDEIAKDLKNRGFRFLGSTIMYSHMQSVGIVNDHLTSCYRHSQIIT